MGDMVRVPSAAEQAVAAIAASDQLKASEGVLQAVRSGFRITSAEDRAQASDTLNLLRRGAKYVADNLTEAFRPWKDREKQLRAPLTHRAQQLEAGALMVQQEMRKWDAERDRLQREAARKAQLEADAAAAAAASAAVGVADDDEALPPAQVATPKPENIVRGAVGKDHKQRKPEAVELVDPLEAREQWGNEVVTLNAKLAQGRYSAKMSLGLLDLPPEGDAGVVVGGIRFVTKVTYVSGRA